ncbi:uncharacterized protein LOC110716606 isoform X1 [Chenopodium quinoa]|uniref:uncharacterized protein LOC110716606 isoform X1 n=1 Tax=Chenopodium quinoa TaxID=63459 RepID=UPI000B785D99|nr:uncharacterized protein LOC110716606 isoform X1 [Chenopodium quinoa]
MDFDKEWTKINDRSLVEYIKGVDNFLNFAFSNVIEDDNTATIRCPCDNCRNLVYKKRCDVRFDLLKSGMYEYYTIWDLHGEKVSNSPSGNINGMEDGDGNGMESDDSGVHMLEDAFGVPGMQGDHLNDYDFNEEPTGDAAMFYHLLKEYEEPLTSNGTTMSKLSYIVKLLHLKVLNNWSDSSFDSLLKLQGEAWGTNLPDSYYEAKKLISNLGLECVKIDACKNDCILYWKQNEHLDKCPTCSLPRYKNVPKGACNGTKKVPRKVLRHFPLKSRLQRLYMSRKTAKDMRWHKEERVDDEVMRHPADSAAWKSFDEEYTSFSRDAHNVRLGLACDGFQPFDNSQHSIWPVLLIPYNLPPWICMKPHSFILSLLIPGTTSPGRNIDVYLQPLIEELKDLWEFGVETYDAYSKQHCNMYAMVLWTISDFPAYADLSGWCTKGHYACPSCQKETKRTSLMSKGCYMCHRRWLPINHKWRKYAKSFDNKKERGHAPVPLTGDEILSCFNRFEQAAFGKVTGQKRKWDASNSLYGLHKKSIFSNYRTGENCKFDTT